MRERPTLTTARAAKIFEEMVEYRRGFCADTQFFKMPDIWEDLCDEEGRWSINIFKSWTGHDSKTKAGVVAFADKVTLTVDEEFWLKAKRKGRFENFTLAHELCHIALGHHQRSATTKNFRLVQRRGLLANVPPNVEEYEANFAAVSLQCGALLLDTRWMFSQLAERALSDEHSVSKSGAMVRLDVFRRELARRRSEHENRPKAPRIVL